MTGNYEREASVTNMLRKLELKTLEERRAVSRQIFFYKVKNNLVAFQEDKFPQSSQRSTRGSAPDSSFIPLLAKKDCYKYSLLPRTIREWNLLPDAVKNANSLNSFKTGLGRLDIANLITRAQPSLGCTRG